MSERNGDKSRYGRRRREKLVQRKLSRELRKAFDTRPETAGGQAGRSARKRLGSPDVGPPPLQ